VDLPGVPTGVPCRGVIGLVGIALSLRAGTMAGLTGRALVETRGWFWTDAGTVMLGGRVDVLLEVEKRLVVANSRGDCASRVTSRGDRGIE